MRRTRPAVPLVLALAAVAAAATVRHQGAGLRWSVPAEWPRVPAPSDVRVAQYRIPGADGAGQDGELVLFHFGSGRGGGVEENLARWYAQFRQPDERPTEEVAVTSKRTVNGLEVTLVDVSGTYRPMGAPPVPDQRMLAAVVKGKGGPWFWKAVGPAATIAAAKPGFDALVGSLEPHR